MVSSSTCLVLFFADHISRAGVRVLLRGYGRWCRRRSVLGEQWLQRVDRLLRDGGHVVGAVFVRFVGVVPFAGKSHHAFFCNLFYECDPTGRPYNMATPGAKTRGDAPFQHVSVITRMCWFWVGMRLFL